MVRCDSMKFFALSIWLPVFFCCSASAHAEEKAKPIVRISVEWIEMSSSDATELLRTPRETTNDSDLRNQVDKLISTDKAVMYESKVTTSRMGKPSRNESVREEIYPTEYDPPSLPGTFSSEADTTPVWTSSSKGLSGFVPTAFETRHTGVSVEIDPSYDSETNTFSLSMYADMVNLVSQNKFATYKDERMKADMTMPIFYTNRFKIHLIVRPGEYLLVTTLTPFDEDGKLDRAKKLVVFVRAELLKVGG